MRPTLLAVIVLALATQAARAAEPPAFAPSYVAGTQDAAGHPMGGTELRNLVVHDGRLFAANGYWKDTPGFGGSPGAQILVLDAPTAPWRVAHEFGETLPNGRRRHLAISALAEVTFRTDANGAPLPAPATLLLASTWDITGRQAAFVRDEASGEWTGTILAEDRPSPGFLPQIRAFGSHRDRATGADLAFAGDTHGIFSATYDPGLPGHLRWQRSPELATDGLRADAFPGLGGRLRISSFAEAGGHLFAAIGQQVWVRADGGAPGWRLFYTNPSPHYSQTGLRGLTAVQEPDGREFLLAAVEGNQSRIVRIDPASGAETTDLDLAALLDAAWATRVSYVIAAYNDMGRLAGGGLAIGLEAFIPPSAPRPPGHVVLDVVHGLEGGAWFLIRHPGGRYDLHRVDAQFPRLGGNLVAARTIVASPFAAERGALYVGGYDANDAPAHDTAWVARATPPPHP